MILRNLVDLKKQVQFISSSYQILVGGVKGKNDRTLFTVEIDIPYNAKLNKSKN